MNFRILYYYIVLFLSNYRRRKNKSFILLKILFLKFEFNKNKILINQRI